MSEKNIQKVNSSFKIVKSVSFEQKIFGTYKSLEDAIFIRDILSSNDWSLDDIPEIHESDGYYYVVKVINEKVYLLAKYRQKPTKEQVDKLTEKKIRNPNNSKYGLNISKVLDIYVIRKTIAGDEYIFGYYDNLEDASFVRNFLMDNEWNVNAFKKVEKDDNGQYKCINVIDDKVCVLNTFETEKEASDNYDDSYNQFVANIYKNKHGIGRFPHLDCFGDIDFETSPKDENWNLKNLESKTAKDLIFDLTPWQKIIYDNSGDEFSFDELKVSLKRYKSKNFDKKVQKHLDELIDLNMIEDLGNDNFKKLKRE